MFSKRFVCECKEYSTYLAPVAAPIFRKSFTLKNNPVNAEITICGLGFYELFVNGEKITKGLLAPYISNPDHYTYFDRYDLAPYLKKGANAIGVMLGDGHNNGKTCIWDFKDNIFNSSPKLALSLEIEDGEEKLLCEADSFLCKKGPILFNDLRSGVFYDARLYEKSWCLPECDESGWHTPMKADPPRGKAKFCEAEPIKIYRTIAPISIKMGEMEPYRVSGQAKNCYEYFHAFEKGAPVSGGYIYDFGENNAGIYRLKIKGTRGQTVSIQCAEQLENGKVSANNINYYPDGFSQRDIYTLSGEGEEIFEPPFTYHGYRYLYVTGITEEQATPDLLTYLVAASALPKRGDFTCSDEVANKIYDMAKRSDISNFFYFPTDCPHREKNGWTGDASVSAEHMIMTIGAENSWKEWLFNIRAAQLECGMLPGIVPTDKWGYQWGNGPAWDSVIFNLPYFAYKYRGCTDIIIDNAEAMIRYLEYISRKRDQNGLVAIGLGDWVPVGRNAADYDSPLAFTDSVMVYDMCRKASEMFEAAGLSVQKVFAEKLGEEMLGAIRKAFVNSKTGEIIPPAEYKTPHVDLCQTSQSMAIFYGIVTDEEKERALDVLVKVIARDGGNINCGFLGLRTMFHVLSENGYADLAYEMITKESYPSYGHWAAMGETTLLEHFLPYQDYYRASKNHHFLGDVINWFMRAAGGIHVQSANSVQIAPKFIKKLDFCEAYHELPSGRISVRWDRKDDGIFLKIKSEGDIKYSVCFDENENVTLL